MTRRETQSAFFKLVKSRERMYAPKIYKAIRIQINYSLVAIKAGNTLDSLPPDEIRKVIFNLWHEVARVWGAKIRAGLPKGTKSRAPIGFNERMAELLSAQYTSADFLNKAEELTETLREWIAGVLAKGYAEGLSIDEIVKKIEDKGIHRNRARLIARTESVSAANAGALIAAQEQGNYNKVWIAARDNRTRHTHVLVNGKTIGPKDYFNVGGFDMLHPGDRGGKDGKPKVPAKELCNCRCCIGFLPIRK